MNNNDPGILCFQHSTNEPNVFCYQVPHFCKFCNADLLTAELQIPPFKVPYPFKTSSEVTNTVVIKPTCGDFLNNYENGADLHIGVTDSEGFVVEYDINGLTRTKASNWNQCLPIKLLKHKSASFQKYWDKILYDAFMGDCWTPERYNAENHNCYSFVLSFLKTLQLEELQPYLMDKVIFCKHFVTPQASIAAKYITLYRQLQKDCMYHN